MLNFFTQVLEGVQSLLYPEFCYCCNHKLKQKDSIWCEECLYKLTPTNYHHQPKNPTLERFWGRVHLNYASSLFLYHRKALIQGLVHQLKYKGRPEIGVELGKWYGGLLRESSHFDKIDLIVPVPMFWKKERQRGYNQAGVFAEGLAESMELPTSADSFLKIKETNSQTTKSRAERFENMREVFRIDKPEALANKHVLLVDDVITTGATIEACILELQKVPDIQISLASIALTTQV
jgi:ComF family protein